MPTSAHVVGPGGINCIIMLMQTMHTQCISILSRCKKNRNNQTSSSHPLHDQQIHSYWHTLFMFNVKLTTLSYEDSEAEVAVCMYPLLAMYDIIYCMFSKQSVFENGNAIKIVEFALPQT